MTSYCNQTVSVVKNNDCCSPTKRTEKYSVTLTVSDTWIMPAVTETTVLTIPNCNNILIGSWLWNVNVGYLEVVKYNAATGETVVRNIGYDDNAPEGVTFPSCMDFVITGPIYTDSIDDNVTCLAADFVSPAVGSCALMKVKSTANLKKDYIIAIEIYQYKVDEVIDNFTVRVCNYGLGKVGTIEANCDGKCVPVRAINANSPCLQDEVHAANAIAVCVGGESKILVGTEDGQIASWSNGSGEWQLINSNIEIDCTVTTNFVNIIYGNVGPYLLNVVSTAPFKVGDRITFNNDHDAYTVSEIISDTQIRLLKKEAPLADEVIDAGARLCIVDCCDWLPAVVENLSARVTDVEDVNAAQNDKLDELESAIEDLEINKADQLTPASILAGSSVVTVSNGVNVILNNNATITVETDLNAYDNTTKNFVIDGANTGTGIAVYDSHTDDNITGDRTLNFRAIKSGDTNKLTVTQQGSDIIITNTMTVPSPGTTNAMANVGTGEGKVYKGTTTSGGVDTFNVKSIKAGTGISVSNGTDDITINNTYAAGIEILNNSIHLLSSDTDLTQGNDHTNLTANVPIGTTSTSTVKIVGSVAITVRGTAHNDSHYSHAYSGNTKPSNDFSDNSFLVFAKNCHVTSSGGVSINGNTIVSGVAYAAGYFFVPHTNSTSGSSGDITQTLYIPFAVTLSSLSAGTTIDIPITVTCDNAHVAGAGVDEDIHCVLHDIYVYTSALIYKL